MERGELVIEKVKVNIYAESVLISRVNVLIG